MSARRFQRGFTLLEVLLVIGLLGALLAFVVPNFAGFERSQGLDESVQRMRALVSMCRAQAANEGHALRLVFRRDGTLRVQQQRDPLDAPNEYVAVKADWAQSPLLPGVWVEAVQVLGDGPPPIQVYDEDRGYLVVEPDEAPTPVADLDGDLTLDVAPDGTCQSLRWILRDRRGLGQQLSLDGRVGRLRVEKVELIALDQAVPPPAETDAQSDEGGR
jgi:prepilin-type N-terminal cleavage/methylation domain-containing protein